MEKQLIAFIFLCFFFFAGREHGKLETETREERKKALKRKLQCIGDTAPIGIKASSLFRAEKRTIEKTRINQFYFL